MWTLLTKKHHSVKPDAHGNKPLDAAISRMQHDPRIIVHLMPQPVGEHPAPDADPKVKPPKPPKVRPGKRGRNAPNVPEELKDCHQQTTNAKPICWAYNLASGCKSNVEGKPPSCSRGAHVCAFCRKVGRSYQQCRSAKGVGADGNPPKN